jgi:tetratricopeptide (TPR) repeat protein
MSTTTVLNDEEWLKLLEYVAEAYTDVTLSRGFTYFKQGQVVSLSISDARLVQAKVDGSEPYRISLNLNKFKDGSCTCPVHGACKHQAAVMMELADRLGYPATQIMNAKMQLKRAASQAVSESAILKLPSLSVSGWQQFLDQYTVSIKPTYDQGIYAQQLRSHLSTLTQVAIPFSDQDRAFFELHQALFLLRKIKGQNTQGGTSFFTSSAIYKIYDDILTWLKEHASQLALSESSERLETTFAYLRTQIAEQQGHSYQDFGVYAALWNEWMTSGNAAALAYAPKEVDAIDTELSDDAAATPSLSAAKAYLYLLMSQSKKAWEALEDGPAFKDTPAYLFVTFFDHLQDTSNWEELVDWLTKTAVFFNNPRTRELDTYAKYWQKAVAHYPEAEELMWKAFESLLPRSYFLIENVLYEQGKWKAWLEMQILQGHDPLFHRVSVLQPIEKEAPQLLLPYYHQAVNHYVGLKNRHDYKAAVRLLKRLEKVYKKMKQPGHWDTFFAGFVERHSRLRALQEELRKGKLLG